MTFLTGPHHAMRLLALLSLAAIAGCEDVDRRSRQAQELFEAVRTQLTGAPGREGAQDPPAGAADRGEERTD